MTAQAQNEDITMYLTCNYINIIQQREAISRYPTFMPMYQFFFCQYSLKMFTLLYCACRERHLDIYIDLLNDECLNFLDEQHNINYLLDVICCSKYLTVLGHFLNNTRYPQFNPNMNKNCLLHLALEKKDLSVLEYLLHGRIFPLVILKEDDILQSKSNFSRVYLSYSQIRQKARDIFIQKFDCNLLYVFKIEIFEYF